MEHYIKEKCLWVKHINVKANIRTTFYSTLQKFDIHVASYVTQIHNIKDSSPFIKIKDVNKKADQSPVRALNKKVEEKMISVIKNRNDDSQFIGNKYFDKCLLHLSNFTPSFVAKQFIEIFNPILKNQYCSQSTK